MPSEPKSPCGTDRNDFPELPKDFEDFRLLSPTEKLSAELLFLQGKLPAKHAAPVLGYLPRNLTNVFEQISALDDEAAAAKFLARFITDVRRNRKYYLDIAARYHANIVTELLTQKLEAEREDFDISQRTNELSIKQLREKYSRSYVDGDVRIKRYFGDDTNVVIPERFGKKRSKTMAAMLLKTPFSRASLCPADCWRLAKRRFANAPS